MHMYKPNYNDNLEPTKQPKKHKDMKAIIIAGTLLGFSFGVMLHVSGLIQSSFLQ